MAPATATPPPAALAAVFAFAARLASRALIAARRLALARVALFIAKTAAMAATAATTVATVTLVTVTTTFAVGRSIRRGSGGRRAAAEETLEPADEARGFRGRFGPRLGGALAIRLVRARLEAALVASRFTRLEGSLLARLAALAVRAKGRTFVATRSRLRCGRRWRRRRRFPVDRGTLGRLGRENFQLGLDLGLRERRGGAGGGRRGVERSR
jgi:hypothetical protein